MGGSRAGPAGGRANGRALDLTNLLLADVQDGIGPFLAIYLLSAQHWHAAAIGVVMSISGIATVLVRTPAGVLIDRLACKREIIVGACAVVACGVALLASLPHFWPVAAAQVAIGGADAVIPPALAAISLGLVGRLGFSGRMGRNQGFNHAGNTVTAILAGFGGTYLAPAAVLWVVAGLAAAGAIATLRIRRTDIDDSVARGCPGPDDEKAAVEPNTGRGSIGRLRHNRTLLIFTACITLFHFANAAMLPLAGEELAHSHPKISSLCMAACIVAAQIVMVPVALLAGRRADAWGRKRLFLAGFAALAIRGLLYTVVRDPIGIVAIQLLDGVGAGLFSVLFFVVVSDITSGSGHTNLAIGATSAAWGLGAACSNTVAGAVAQHLGMQAAFFGLSCCALLAFVLFLVLMPETGPDADPDAGWGSSARPAPDSPVGPLLPATS
ncbi:MFS transporter [Lichenicoccus sp.]|uniref:MFS transporter n=1 Tax=Lichenicoccus sp. TaxID=2781899 RepID=UPI003D0A5D4D